MKITHSGPQKMNHLTLITADDCCVFLDFFCNNYLQSCDNSDLILFIHPTRSLLPVSEENIKLDAVSTPEGGNPA